MSLNPKGPAAPEAAQGTDSPEEFESPKYMTSDEFNRAFTGRQKAFEKSIAKLLEDRFPQSQPPAHLQQQQEPGANPTNPNPPLRMEDTPAYRETRRELEELRKGLVIVQAERDQERQRAHDMTKRTMVQERLQAAGITGPHLKFATNEVLASTRYDDESQSFVFGEGHEALPFDSGVKTWLKTEDARALMPPRGAVGSGSAPGSAPASRGVATEPAANPDIQFLTMAGLIPSSG